MKKGKIIAIEGNDGVGKQTQSKLLCDYLNSIGIKTELLSFPNYKSDSSSIVKMYLNGDLGDINSINPDQHSMIYAIDRFATIKQKKVKEKLEEGTWFVMDRYVLSNAIYALAKYDLIPDTEFNIKEEAENILRMEDILGIPAPNINFILKLSSDFSNKLRDNRKNKINNSDKKDIHESNDEYLNKVNCIIDIVSEIEYLWYGSKSRFNFDNIHSNVNILNIPIECDNGEEILSKESIHSMIIRKLIENGVK